MLTRPEIYKLVHEYIGVIDGYLGDFSYRTHTEFYPNYCDLDIDPNQYEGTTRERFLQILQKANPIEQAKIVKGILTKYPVSHFSAELQPQKQILYDEFMQTIERLDPQNALRRGVSGEIKNLIFAANGPKPDIILADAMSNSIRIVNHAEHCLVYDQPISDNGLLWNELTHWWAGQSTPPSIDMDTEHHLYRRLETALASPPERLLFATYFRTLRREMQDRFPALCPQVYLHYDPKTLQELKGGQRIPRQRMDFLVLLSNSDRIVIEVDGKHHYAEDDRASPKRYAEMVAEDRNLRLHGYEVYRFGGYELDERNGKIVVEQFFRRLYKRYGLL
jgi:very-short-patch-repair endonuclease